jgi:hypothetical protein
MGQLLLDLIKSLFSIAKDNVKILIERHSLAISYVATFTLSTSILITLISDFVKKIFIVAPPEVTEAMAFIMPSNVGACLVTLITARIFSSLYLLKLRAANQILTKSL